LMSTARYWLSALALLGVAPSLWAAGFLQRDSVKREFS